VLVFDKEKFIIENPRASEWNENGKHMFNNDCELNSYALQMFLHFQRLRPKYVDLVKEEIRRCKPRKHRGD
jgi:hypothetical protein